MGYILKAFIGKGENLIAILEKYNTSQKVDLNNGISMIPMTEFGENSMNETLKHLGVKRKQLVDEFETVGLAKNRYTEDWIKY